MRLLVATTNAGKLRDFRFRMAVTAGSIVEIEPMPGLSALSAPDEDEDSFEGNAKIKAIYYSGFAANEIVIADDSGLEVDVLGGSPGVRSARYADDCGFQLEASGTLSPDERNNACLMHALRSVPTGDRSGRFRCALVAARDGRVLAVGVGAVEGRIVSAPQGSGGFGYDPYFVPESETESMAELSPGRRMELSHRGRALDDLMARLGAV